MIHYFKRLFQIVAALVLTACAAAPQQIAPFDTSRTYDQSFDETWGKMVRFMSTNSVGISTIEKDSGLIVINNQSVATSLMREYCDVPAVVPGLYSPTHGIVRGSLTAIEEDGFTTVNVNVNFTQNSQFCYQGCQYVSRPCASLGNFEKALLNAID